MTLAYCHQSGHIDFAETAEDVPVGTIVFAEGKGKRFRDTVSARARHAKDSDAILIPGLPEADSEDEAFRAFAAWKRWAFPKYAYWFQTADGPLSRNEDPAPRGRRAGE